MVGVSTARFGEVCDAIAITQGPRNAAGSLLSQFLSQCVTKPFYSSRRDHQGAATFRSRRKVTATQELPLDAV
jgi:hypothetical protein